MDICAWYLWIWHISTSIAADYLVDVDQISARPYYHRFTRMSLIIKRVYDLIGQCTLVYLFEKYKLILKPPSDLCKIGKYFGIWSTVLSSLYCVFQPSISAASWASWQRRWSSQPVCWTSTTTDQTCPLQPGCRHSSMAVWNHYSALDVM